MLRGLTRGGPDPIGDGVVADGAGAVDAASPAGVCGVKAFGDLLGEGPGIGPARRGRSRSRRRPGSSPAASAAPGSRPPRRSEAPFHNPPLMIRRRGLGGRICHPSWDTPPKYPPISTTPKPPETEV